MEENMDAHMLMGDNETAMTDVEQKFEYESEIPSPEMLHLDATLRGLNLLAEKITQDVAAKGFHEDDILPQHAWVMLKNAGNDELAKAMVKAAVTNRKLARLALITSEISEALEGIRKEAMDDKLPHRKQEEVELADAVIRILDYAGFYGLDLGGAIKEKLEYNKGRAYKHGKVV